MPVAWGQYTAEHPRVIGTTEPTSCPPFIFRMVGRDSTHIVAGEVLRYGDENDANGDRHRSARVRVLRLLKGVWDWKIGEIRDVKISTRVDERNLNVHAGSRLILIAGFGPLWEMRIDPGYDCPVLFLNKSNLAEIVQGIEQDYAANEQAKWTIVGPE